MNPIDKRNELIKQGYEFTVEPIKNKYIAILFKDNKLIKKGTKQYLDYHECMFNAEEILFNSLNK